MNDKLLYRIPEVAEHLSISRSKVCELLKSGELRSTSGSTTQRSRSTSSAPPSPTGSSWPLSSLPVTRSPHGDGPQRHPGRLRRLPPCC
jgi:hypothetical protein